jgi:hypothetical protein
MSISCQVLPFAKFRCLFLIGIVDVVVPSVLETGTLSCILRRYHNGEHYSAILPKESSTALAEEKWHHVLSTDKVPPFGTSGVNRLPAHRIRERNFCCGRWVIAVRMPRGHRFNNAVALLAYESHSITSRDTFGSDMTMDQSTLTVNSAQGSDKAMSNRKRKELEKQVGATSIEGRAAHRAYSCRVDDMWKCVSCFIYC